MSDECRNTDATCERTCIPCLENNFGFEQYHVSLGFNAMLTRMKDGRYALSFPTLGVGVPLYDWPDTKSGWFDVQDSKDGTTGIDRLFMTINKYQEYEHKDMNETQY